MEDQRAQGALVSVSWRNSANGPQKILVFCKRAEGVSMLVVRGEGSSSPVLLCKYDQDVHFEIITADRECYCKP